MARKRQSRIISVRKENLNGRQNDSPNGRRPRSGSNDSNSEGRVLYISGFARDTRESDVKSMFGAYGELTEVKVLKDMISQEVRGFGFVTFAHTAEAKTAIQELNGKKVGEKTLLVQVAHRSHPRHKTPGQYLGRRNNPDEPERPPRRRNDLNNRDSYQPRYKEGERERERRREGEGEFSHRQRHSGRDLKHHRSRDYDADYDRHRDRERDRDLDRDRDRDRDRTRDRDIDRDRDQNRTRDRDYDRRRDRSHNHDRDAPRDRDRDRDRDRHRSRDRHFERRSGDNPDFDDRYNRRSRDRYADRDKDRAQYPGSPDKSIHSHSYT